MRVSRPAKANPKTGLTIVGARGTCHLQVAQGWFFMAPNGKQMFPCPVCTEPREVRETKKSKPYLICDPCGVQVFVRGPAGIGEFNRLLPAHQ